MTAITSDLASAFPALVSAGREVVAPHHARRPAAHIEREASGPTDPQSEQSDRHPPPRNGRAVRGLYLAIARMARRSHVSPGAAYCGRSTLTEPLDGVRHGHVWREPRVRGGTSRPGRGRSAGSRTCRGPARALEADAWPAVLEAALHPAAAAHVVDEQVQAGRLTVARRTAPGRRAGRRAPGSSAPRCAHARAPYPRPAPGWRRSCWLSGTDAAVDASFSRAAMRTANLPAAFVGKVPTRCGARPLG